MSREPNPFSAGGATGGPPSSFQQSWSRALFPWRMLQVIVTRPSLFDSAPYFAALVHSSCKATAIASAALGDSRTQLRRC